MPEDFWGQVDRFLEMSQDYRLNDEEREHIQREEQSSFERNIESISEILNDYKIHLEERGFWTECQVSKDGVRFRYNILGYYGPGGFSSQFHIAGPLVLGEIQPKGDPIQSFYPNDLDECEKIGADYTPESFSRFVEKNILDFLSPENLIITRDQYERIRALYPH